MRSVNSPLAPVPIKPEHKMTKAQALKEFKANGFKLVRQYDRLPQQHLLFMGKDSDWKESDR